jgi:hypothetical protein
MEGQKTPDLIDEYACMNVLALHYAPVEFYSAERFLITSAVDRWPRKFVTARRRTTSVAAESCESTAHDTMRL